MRVPVTNVNAQEPYRSHRTGEPPVHAIEPELRMERTPRAARWQNHTVLRVSLLWFGWLGLVYWGYAGYRHSHKMWTALIAHGVTTQGTVYDKEPSRRKSSARKEIEFRCDSGVAKISESVSDDEFDRTRIGDAVTVTYLPGWDGEVWAIGKPTIAQRDADISNNYGFFAFVLLGLLGIPAFHTYRALSQFHLARYGVPVIGHLRSHYIHVGNKGQRTYYIRFGYSVGERYIDKKIAVSEDGYYSVQGNWNNSITVLYDASRPKWSIPYEAATEVYLVDAAPYP